MAGKDRPGGPDPVIHNRAHGPLRGRGEPRRLATAEALDGRGAGQGLINAGAVRVSRLERVGSVVL